MGLDIYLQLVVRLFTFQLCFNIFSEEPINIMLVVGLILSLVVQITCDGKLSSVNKV